MDTLKAILHRQLAVKRARRRELARLPIEKKLEILLRMQRTAAQVLRTRGIRVRVWGETTD